MSVRTHATDRTTLQPVFVGSSSGPKLRSSLLSNQEEAVLEVGPWRQTTGPCKPSQLRGFAVGCEAVVNSCASG